MLRIAGCGKPHALFILAAIERKLLPDAVQGFAEAGYVAMSEDAEAASADPHFPPVDIDILI